jgi:hypothetical protein
VNRFAGSEGNTKPAIGFADLRTHTVASRLCCIPRTGQEAKTCMQRDTLKCISMGAMNKSGAATTRRKAPDFDAALNPKLHNSKPVLTLTSALAGAS